MEETFKLLEKCMNLVLTGAPGTGGGSSVRESNPKQYRYTLKRHITTKADLIEIINQLQQHINELDSGSSIELELND